MVKTGRLGREAVLLVAITRRRLGELRASANGPQRPAGGPLPPAWLRRVGRAWDEPNEASPALEDTRKASEKRSSEARQRRVNLGKLLFARFPFRKLCVNVIKQAGELLVVMFFTVAQGLG
jgi:hypothetical protein